MMPSLDGNWQGLPPHCSLGERDTDVLSLVDEEDLTTFTFDGLKRRLGLHPETLSRILNRLEEEGIVKKTPEGYEVTPKITKLKLSPARRETQNVSLLQTFLPSNMMTQQLISKKEMVRHSPLARHVRNQRRRHPEMDYRRRRHTNSRKYIWDVA
jgi:DNA-binding transcriptional ArsR family regulator